MNKTSAILQLSTSVLGRRNSNAQTAASPLRWAKTKMALLKMRTLIFLSFLLLTLSVSAQQSVDNSYIFTKVTKERYSLSYLKSWTIDTSKMFGMDILLRSPKTDSLDDFIENISVFVQDLHGMNYNLSKMGKESEAQIKKMVTEVQIIDSRLDSTISPQTYILKYIGRQGKFLLTTIQHYYLKDEVGYALTMTIKEGEEQDYILAAEKIFESFSFRQ